MKKIGILVCAFALVILTGCTRNNTETVIETLSEEDKGRLAAILENREALTQQASEAEQRKVVQLEENGSVYYFAADGKRYIFPTQETFVSWYGEYQVERVMPLVEMQEIPLGGNVTIKPGNLLQTPTDFNVYLVTERNMIAPVDEWILEAVHGEAYRAEVIDLQNYYFTNYVYGAPITSLDQYPTFDASLTIDKNKGLESIQ